MRFLLLSLVLLSSSSAVADYRITRDHGGLVEQYKERYAELRDKDERIIIDGICNSACTLFFGIVPLNRVCVTPRASLGFHQAYFDKAWTYGVKVLSFAGTEDLLSYYPSPVLDWIDRQGGLTPEMEKVKNGPDPWANVDPRLEEFAGPKRPRANESRMALMRLPVPVLRCAFSGGGLHATVLPPLKRPLLLSNNTSRQASLWIGVRIWAACVSSNGSAFGS